MGNRNRQTGFTLVEILIVVVILGILAAIVIPQFTNASESAKASSLTSQIQTIRSQLQLFQIQHNGDYPELVGEETDGSHWALMTETTDASHTAAGEALTDGTGEFGPYLQQPPANPFVDRADRFTVVDGDETSAPTNAAWVYDAASGEIWAVLPDGINGDDLGLSESDYVGGGTGTE